MQSRSMAIPIKKTSNNNDNSSGKLTISSSSVDDNERHHLLSKSLDMPQMHSFLSRRNSEVSEITYSGYLWKRSNRPLKTVSPFPMDSLENNNTGRNTSNNISGNISQDRKNNCSNINHDVNNNTLNGPDGFFLERSPLLQPKPHSIEDSLVGAGARAQREGREDDLATPPDTAYEPKQPLHIGLCQGDFLGDGPALSASEAITQQTKTTTPSQLLSGRNDHSTTPTTASKGNLLQPALDFAASFFGLTLEGPKEDEEQEKDEQEKDEQLNIFSSSSDPTALVTNAVDVSPTFSLNNGMTSTTSASSYVSSLPLPPLPKSTPIKMPSSSVPKGTPWVQGERRTSAESTDSYFDEAAHRRVSAPCMLDNFDGGTPTSCDSNPPNILDPNDGHLWRAKYCVLQDGILYFYRNATDAKSAEAILERQHAADDSASIDEGDITDEPISSSFAPATILGGTNNDRINNNSRSFNNIDLSKSPMPRPSLFEHIAGAGSSNSSNGNCNGLVMWEKRVALNCVGAVRSAESEFGKNSFELLAVEGEDGQGDEDELQESLRGYQEHNKLVLRAGNQDEMNEWLFQFHCSLASFMRNVMDLCVASSERSYLGDLHHSVFQEPATTSKASTTTVASLTSKAASLSPFNPYLVPFSPRFLFKGSASPAESSLSHGHGRCATHRRRLELHSAKSFDASSPQQVTTSSPLQFSMTSLTPTTSTNLSLPRGLPLPVHAQETTRKLVSSVENENTYYPPAVTKAAEEAAAAAVAGGGEINPELSAPQSSCPPETERPLPKPTGKYIPPFMRRKQAEAAKAADSTGIAQKPAKKYIPPHLRKDMEKTAGGVGTTENSYVPRHVRQSNLIAPVAEEESLSALKNGDDKKMQSPERVTLTIDVSSEQKDLPNHSKQQPDFFCLGGCADPRVVTGSIMDDRFIPRKASKIGPVQTEPLGSSGGGPALRWEVGAVSECGIRSSNEDSYLVSNNLIELFKKIEGNDENNLGLNHLDRSHPPSIFAVFDGHCGDQAARYAAERLHHFLHEEFQSKMKNSQVLDSDDSVLHDILREALTKLDWDFCKFCVEGNRQWESGATALVAMLVNERLIVANIGDCRGVFCRTIKVVRDIHSVSSPSGIGGWNELPAASESIGAANNMSSFTDGNHRRCLWKEVAEVHSPSREQERKRIENANGWTTTEKEIPVGQLKRMDFLDEDVIEILKRCFYDRINSDCANNRALPQRILHISRVCGELAVSRAIGDRDFKAAHNSTGADDTTPVAWQCPLFLSYPKDHTQKFDGDLVSGTPDLFSFEVGSSDAECEFLLLACDGLWDVIDAEDAVRVTRDLLLEKKWSAQKAAARLAELAIHLGSSDNVTVLVIRIHSKNGEDEGS